MLRWLVVACWLCGCNQIFHIPDVKQSNDACGDGLAKCDPNASCTDAAGGSFSCACNMGFTGDGLTCTDVDECSASPAPCSAHASCTNTPGAFTCACDSGFTGDGTTYCEPATWQKVSAASGYSCGVGGDGGLYCWGTNTAGFGDGTTVPHERPTQIGTATDWIDVVVRQLRACGIRSDHSLWCWGWGARGELGDGMMTSEATPTMVISDKSGVGWKQVAIGAQTVCGLHTDGSAACWGFDRITGASRPLPVAVDTNTDWTQIAVGRVYCGLRGSTGTLWCWGKSAAGDLGLGTVTNQTTPAQVGTDTWKQVSVGSFDNVCAIRHDNALFCWGNSPFYPSVLQYGTTPQQIGTATDWQEVAVGYATILGLRNGGVAYAWGENDFGEAAVAQLGDLPNPTPISGTVTGWSEIDVQGESPACGISGGRAYCWGLVGDGNLGNGQSTTYYSPTKIGSDTWSSIAGGPGLCGVRSDNALLCWGMNIATGVGFGNTDPVWTPTRLGTASWSQIAGGGGVSGSSSCAIRNSLPYCWGDNSFGQLGLGNTTTPQLSPAAVTVPPTSMWSGFAVADHTCALSGGSSLYCWGNNDTSQLGDGTTTATAAPGTPLAGSWLEVAVAQYGYPGSMTCGIQSNGSLWCWGQDQYPSTAIHAMPTAVGSDTSWAHIAMGSTTNQMNSGPTTCAIKTNGTLWCWGLWLGDGTLDSSTVPVQVGTDTWKSIAIAGEICGVKTDGTLWCWGNSYILGDGKPPTFDLATLYLNTTTRPTQIGTDSDWTSVITNGVSAGVSCALKQDGSLWCWGQGAAPVTGIISVPSPL